MSTTIQQSKFKFLTNWTLLSLGIIPLSYIISLIAVDIEKKKINHNIFQINIVYDFIRG